MARRDSRAFELGSAHELSSLQCAQRRLACCYAATEVAVRACKARHSHRRTPCIVGRRVPPSRCRCRPALARASCKPCRACFLEARSSVVLPARNFLHRCTKLRCDLCACQWRRLSGSEGVLPADAGRAVHKLARQTPRSAGRKPPSEPHRAVQNSSERGRAHEGGRTRRDSPLRVNHNGRTRERCLQMHAFAWQRDTCSGSKGAVVPPRSSCVAYMPGCARRARHSQAAAAAALRNSRARGARRANRISSQPQARQQPQRATRQHTVQPHPTGP